MPEDIQELKSHLENMRGQCILGQCCAELDVHDMTVLLTMIDKHEKQQQEIKALCQSVLIQTKKVGQKQREIERLKNYLVQKIATTEERVRQREEHGLFIVDNPHKLETLYARLEVYEEIREMLNN
jgi:hypothetical protein